jgi:pilus assembly protein Flp/PilA
MRMWQKLAFTAKTFAYCQSGATAIEYGLIVTGIAVAILTVVNSIGTSMNATFKSISTQM